MNRLKLSKPSEFLRRNPTLTQILVC